LAAVAAVALLGPVACGGGSSTTGSTASQPGKQKALDAAQLAQLDSAAHSLVSAALTFVPKASRCVVSAHPKTCVQSAARPADAAVTKARNQLTALEGQASGACAAELGSVTEAISGVTDVLRPMTVAMLNGRFSSASRLAAGVQTQLRDFAGRSQAAKAACTG
jgi:hypothetical protein